jgi:hypothetical protein
MGPGSAEPAAGPIAGQAGPRADGPAASLSIDAEWDEGARIATNEASDPRGQVERAVAYEMRTAFLAVDDRGRSRSASGLGAGPGIVLPAILVRASGGLLDIPIAPAMIVVGHFLLRGAIVMLPHEPSRSPCGSVIRGRKGPWRGGRPTLAV